MTLPYSKGKNLYVFSYTDPCGKRNSFYAKDIKKLRDKEKMLQRNLFDGLDAYLLAKADVNYVFDRYIETKYGLKNSTKANYIYAYNKYVRDTLGKRKLSTVRYSDVVLFYKTLLDKGLSAGTIDNVHTVLHSALQIAVRDNIIRMNPADGAMAEVKRRIGRVSSRHSLTYEQEKARQDAGKNIVRVSIVDNRTIAHEVTMDEGATKVIIKPASAGTGLVAGSAVRSVLEIAGNHDIISKSLGARSKINMARATINALLSIKTIEQVQEERGKTREEILG